MLKRKIKLYKNLLVEKMEIIKNESLFYKDVEYMRIEKKLRSLRRKILFLAKEKRR